MAYSIKNEFEYKKNNSVNIDNYINNRLLAQIKWYDEKSTLYQKRYKLLSVLSITLSALIPVLTLALDFDCEIFIRFIIAILSAIVSIISGILAIYKYKELWVQYRTSCELLKSVLHRYYTHTGEFSEADEKTGFETLVASCEQYFTKEFNGWNNIYTTQNHSSTSS